MRKKAIGIFIEEKKGKPVWMQAFLGKLFLGKDGIVQFKEEKILISQPFERLMLEKLGQIAREQSLDRFTKRGSERQESLCLPKYEEQPLLW